MISMTSDPHPADIKVSVCMITYNHEAYIAEAIESVLMQKTDFPVELVIGEDCSTDGTRAIVLDYAARYPDRIRPLLPEKNLGVGLNSVATLEECRGQYVALLDGDDYWTDPLKLQKQVDFLEENPEYVMCHHNAMIIDSAGDLVTGPDLPVSPQRDFSSEELIKGAWVRTLTACFRNVLEELPPEFNKVLAGDKFLWSLLGHYGPSKYLGDTIEPAAYRIHPGGVWSSLAGEIERTIRRLGTNYWMGAYYKRVQLPQYSDYFSHWLPIGDIFLDPERIEDELMSCITVLDDYLIKKFGRDSFVEEVQKSIKAVILVTAGFVQFSWRNWALGRLHLQEAIELDPVSWRGGSLRDEHLVLQSHVLGTASKVSSPDRLVNYIEGIHYHLPLEMRPDKNVIRKTTGKVYSEVAYLHYLAGNYVGVRDFTWQAIKLDPGLLKDRGMLKRALRI